MQAKALICTQKQQFSFETVQLGELGENDILVRTLYSGVSIGTEFALIRNKLSWGPFPICTGYQGVGVVEQHGSNVTAFRPGQKVYYRMQKPFFLGDTPVSPACGIHCSHAVIGPSETHGPAVLPDGVDEQAASLFVMPSVALHGVDMAGIGVGDTVLVQGVGMIGLGSVAIAFLRGARVMAVDIDDHRLNLADRLGAEQTVNVRGRNPVEAVRNILPEGADVVIEATGNGSLLDPAIQMTRKFGKFIFQGNYGKDSINLNFLNPHDRQLQAFFPCDDGYVPCREAVIRLMAAGALPFEKTITHRIPAEEAATFFAQINTGQADGVIGAVIDWKGINV